MAIRNIRIDGDEILRKVSREVEKVDDRILTLLGDMEETMRNAEGVGLAAPQVGVLRRVIIVDIGEGLIELINPIIIYKDGEQLSKEGCLSVPSKSGSVKRPKKVIVRAINRKGETVEIEGEDLLAVAISHEIDHLDGVLFIDKAVNIETKRNGEI